MSIQFKNLSYEYSPDTPFAYLALKNINLTIRENKMTAIVGATGSGKSTLVQHLNALLVPTSGELVVDDKVIYSDKKNTGLKALREKVGLVFQFPEAQLFEETILKDVMFGPLNFRKTEDEAKALATQALELVNIDRELYNQSPLELSGGQKRRVAIAGILALNPDILVCDEPTAGLDPQGQIQIMELFDRFKEQDDKSVILVTHDLQDVLDYADDVVVMAHGEVIFHDTKEAFFNRTDLLSEIQNVLPKVIQFREALNKKGFNISDSVTDLEQLVYEIMKEIDHE